ncbi:uncharacterized protein PODANS_1_17360 [Podospora anserina S mat+]|uniref:Podospora anserina S mat+ genomic DNA chromosome 1, supercontig 4 n=1 Tax=Podospora anserina (strain S / ATCC MYA-4624 / DSM 980 / FGSC 10383) TaxID=515849 RepID=B2ATY4_PODAN|nr:uncharacterized protein PODANS_1_17360 [Podospora anserina S mat+]CAP67857.1 unnamed protein product [Podospora anserina S mat+]CDP24116.1 Putative protein of unknown function [Podospora anserina S mat+]
MIIPASRPLLVRRDHTSSVCFFNLEFRCSQTSQRGTPSPPKRGACEQLGVRYCNAAPLTSWSFPHELLSSSPNTHHKAPYASDLYSRPAKFYHYPAISQKLGDRFPSAKRHPPTSSRVSTAWGFGRYGAKSPEATLDGQALDAERLMRPVCPSLNTEESLILAGHRHEKMRIGMDRDKPSVDKRHGGHH